MDRQRWEPVVEAFTQAGRGCRLQREPIDIRRNVKFKGGYLSQWIHDNYPDAVCSLAIEVKKVFMDEWTGSLFRPIHDEIGRALRVAADAAREALAEMDG
jgi:hypothetical protein